MKMKKALTSLKGPLTFKLPLWVCLSIVLLTSSTVAYGAIFTLKTIHGTAIVSYLANVSITKFVFVGSSAVNVTLQASSAIACVINISGAGIQGSANVAMADWSGSPPTVTKTVNLTGTLTPGNIVIEVTS